MAVARVSVGAWAVVVGALLASAIARGGGTAAPAASEPAVPRVKLWDKTPGVVMSGEDRDIDPIEPRMDVYLPEGGGAPTAAVLVLPGGGYTNLAVAKEGTAVAKMLVSHRVAAFVVMYRHAQRYHYPIPVLDAQRALRTVRAKAGEYHVEAQKIGIMGFSAGGHLAASVATMYDMGPKPENPDVIDGVSARPNFAILMYPVINMTDDAVTHKGSRSALTQNNKDMFAMLSPELHVTKQTPPVFLVHGSNDTAVPVMNSVLMYEACLKAGVPAEMHIFENGPHGFGLAATDAQLKVWPELLLGWMERNKWAGG